MKRIVGLITGGFDPIHGGHIDYIQEAATKCDFLYVGVNSNAWLERKKGYFFQNWGERLRIIKNIKCVDYVLGFDDSDDSACDAINIVKDMEKKKGYDSVVIFMNGGDRNSDNIPEMVKFAGDAQVEFQFGIGGTRKQNSSSHLVAKVRGEEIVQRNWGYFRVIHYVQNETTEIKVKELVVNPGASLSMQRHQYRDEVWFLKQGQGKIDFGMNELKPILPNKFYYIAKNQWHRLVNSGDEPLHIIEVQQGTYCIEEDIQRK